MGVQWLVPPGMSGEPRLIRIGPGAIGEEAYACPTRDAAKSRPAVQPTHRPRWPKPRLEQFALGPLTSAIDAVEFDGVAPGTAIAGLRNAAKPLHPGLLNFVENALRVYLARRAFEADEDLQPVREFWVARRENGSIWELYAWGRRYQSRDGRLRELRLLRFGSVLDRRRNDDEAMITRERARTAIAAYSAAFGSPALWPRPAEWAEPFTFTGAAPQMVERVRVVEVGLADGSCTPPLFDGTPSEAQRYYTRHGHDRVRQTACGGSALPGSACTDCKVITACDALPRVPGLLGLPASKAPLRKVSISDLRYYGECPAQAHLRSLHLPKQGEYGPAAVRGQAVHHHLAVNHGNPLVFPCSEADMTVDTTGWSAGPWRVEGAQALAGARMLAHHLDVCPLRSPVGVRGVQVEPTLAYHDTAANVVVLVSPDLIYEEDGSVIWRETKSTRLHRWSHDDPLEQFPQLALAVLILARGLLGGDPAGSRVELETLRVYAADVELIDPTDPERVAKAQEVIRRLAEPWHADQTFPATPGPACHSCPVSRWCPSRAEVLPADQSPAGGGGRHG